jgi:hypothetical protein
VFVLDPLDTFEDPDDIVWAKEREIRRVHELIVQGYYDAEPVFIAPDAATARLDFLCANLRLPKPSREARNGNTAGLLLSPNSVLPTRCCARSTCCGHGFTRPGRRRSCSGSAPRSRAPRTWARTWCRPRRSCSREFSIDTAVQFGALDNAQYDVVHG